MSLAEAASRYYKTREASDADLFVETLEQRLQELLLEDEEAEEPINVLLDELQDILVEDLVQASEALSIEETTSSSTLDGGETHETLIQATSLTLLPTLLHFPNTSIEASEALLRLCLLVAQRGYPKEVWMAIETSLEKIASSSDRLAEDDVEADIEVAIAQLVKALLTAKIVVPRIQARRPSTFFFSFFTTLCSVLDKLQESLAQEPEESFPAPLLLISILDLVKDVYRIAQGPNLEQDERFLLILHGCIVLAYILCSPSLQSGPPLSVPANLARRSLNATAESSGADYRCIWDELLAALASIDCDTDQILRSIVKDPSESSDLQASDCHVLNAMIVLAHEKRLERQPDLVFVLEYTPELLDKIWSTRNNALGGRALDALIYLCQQIVEDASKGEGSGNSSEQEIDSEVVLGMLKSFSGSLDRIPPALTPGAISLVEVTVLEYADGKDDLQDRMLDIFTHESAPLPCKNIGIRLFRSLLLQAFSAHAAVIRFPTFLERFGRSIFKYDRSSSTLDQFWDGAVESLLISQLNLLYLILQNDQANRSLDIWKEEHLAEVSLTLLGPIRQDFDSLGGEGGADFEVVMARNVLSETLDRVEKALPVRT